jgi:hypothetical protein
MLFAGCIELVLSPAADEYLVPALKEACSHG